MTLVYHVRSLSLSLYIYLFVAIFEEMARATKLANENENAQHKCHHQVRSKKEEEL